MELELQRKSLDGFQLILNRSLVQEETVEGIVPDTCPDIMRIVNADGMVSVTARELSMGSLRLNGMVRASVLYMPEGEDGPRHMEISIPFVCSLDDPELDSGCSVWVQPRLNGIDAREINSRKVLVRAEVILDVQVYGPGQQQVCCGATGSEQIGLQQRKEEREAWLICAINEKAVSFSDVLSIPGSRPKAAELLSSRVEAGALESKFIGGKLVIKGEAQLIALYRTQEGDIAAVRFDLPYSQVMELPGAGEDSQVQIEMAICGLECILQLGDPGAFSVTLELLLHATAVEKRVIPLLNDMYATTCLVELERENFNLCTNAQCLSQREGIRQFCECGIPAKTVVDAFLSIGRVTMAKEDNKTICRTDAAVSILFLSEDDALCCVTYPITVNSEAKELKGKGACIQCRRIGELTAVPITGGLEVRFDVEFSGLSMVETACPFVSDARILPLPEGGVGRPSVVLRMLGEGESLWEVAKAYQSTVEDIAAANELEGEQAPQGCILLIPRRR